MNGATSFRELLDRYQRGERDFAESDLDTDTANDLRGACLDGIDLSRSYVVASFRGARLRGAVFRGANVKTCDFSGADLTGADFCEAALCATTFAGAQMQDAQFGGAFYHSYRLQPGEQPDW
ncbi:MAG TPA: pentapeptide repeat-containing protein [Gemmataceae bacterium]|nr:pentapeptide repeat-containing protein [Gemmataceae bacterium]